MALFMRAMLKRNERSSNLFLLDWSGCLGVCVFCSYPCVFKAHILRQIKRDKYSECFGFHSFLEPFSLTLSEETTGWLELGYDILHYSNYYYLNTDLG